jgi:hypothetical protein
MPGFDDFMTWFASGRFLVLAGLLQIGLGAARWFSQERLLAWRAAGDRKWRARLVTWGAVGADDESDLARQVRRYWYRLWSITAIATGLVVTLAGVAQGAAPWFGASALIDPSQGSSPWPTTWLMYLALVPGVGLGYPAAVVLTRRIAPGGPRYADLHQRRLSDYRAPGFRWLVAAIVLVQVAVTLAFGLGRAPWPILVVPAETILAFVACELLMSVSVGASRMVVTAEPAVARRCDDLIRSQVIASLQGLELSVLGLGCVVQGFVFVRHGAAPDRAVMLALLLLILDAALAAFAAIGLSGLEERLGGRVSGWWGRPMPD